LWFVWMQQQCFVTVWWQQWPFLVQCNAHYRGACNFIVGCTVEASYSLCCNHWTSRMSEIACSPFTQNFGNCLDDYMTLQPTSP
jgi:hypothetical protein